MSRLDFMILLFDSVEESALFRFFPGEMHFLRICLAYQRICRADCTFFAKLGRNANVEANLSETKRVIKHAGIAVEYYTIKRLKNVQYLGVCELSSQMTKSSQH